MKFSSQIVVGTLFGIFIATAWHLAMIERDQRMLKFYCMEYNICSSSERP